MRQKSPRPLRPCSPALPTWVVVWCLAPISSISRCSWDSLPSLLAGCACDGMASCFPGATLPAGDCPGQCVAGAGGLGAGASLAPPARVGGGRDPGLAHELTECVYGGAPGAPRAGSSRGECHGQ